MSPISPIDLQIIEGALESAMREIHFYIQRVGRSTIIREVADYRAGIFNAAGKSMTSLSYAPTPTPIMRKFEGRVYEGDVFFHNNPYKSDGGISHLPDICSTVPIFVDGTIMGWVMAFGHVQDIGGMEISSMPMLATDIHQEGLMLPPVKIFERGERNEALWDVIGDNSRFPTDLLSDLDAFINASYIGVRRVQELVARYGGDTVNAAFDTLLDRCGVDLLRDALPQIPNGRFEFEDYTEYDDVQPLDTRRILKLRMAMEKTPEKVTFDFTGTAEQSPGNVNWPGDERFYAKYFGTLLKSFAPDVVVNDGVTEVVECVLPEGCLLNPKYPAAVAHRSNALLRMLDVGAGVLARATGGMVPAASETLSWYMLYGYDENGDFISFRDITGAGSGARSFADGDDTVYFAPDSRNMPGEVTEQLFPLRFERIGLRPDSGGPGKYRGGMGYIRDLRILFDCTLVVIADRGQLNPWGVAGGKAGASARRILNPGTPEARDLPSMLAPTAVKAGDLLRVMTCGGGGWGDPLERDPEAVRIDFMRGLVTASAAHDHYGVVFRGEGLEAVIDEAATERRKAEIVEQRPELRLYDRGERYWELVEDGVIVPTVDDPVLEAATAEAAR